MGIRNRDYDEMTKLLKYKWFQLRRIGKWSHEFWYNSETKKGTIVVKPHWGDKVSADGTFLWMLEKAGISKEEAREFKESRCKG